MRLIFMRTLWQVLRLSVTKKSKKDVYVHKTRGVGICKEVLISVI